MTQSAPVKSVNAGLADELAVRESQVAATVRLLDEGATLLIIARYRKEVTGCRRSRRRPPGARHVIIERASEDAELVDTVRAKFWADGTLGTSQSSSATAKSPAAQKFCSQANSSPTSLPPWPRPW